MKKCIALAFLMMVACHKARPGTGLTGAPAPRLAVEQFMSAVKAQDLQAMSVVWGTSKGPAREQLDRKELDQRLIIMQGCYEHDRYQILEETPGPSGERLVHLSVTRGRRTKSPVFATVKGPSNRWYVLDADFNSMKDLCRQS